MYSAVAVLCSIVLCTTVVQCNIVVEQPVQLNLVLLINCNYTVTVYCCLSLVSASLVSTEAVRSFEKNHCTMIRTIIGTFSQGFERFR